MANWRRQVADVDVVKIEFAGGGICGDSKTTALNTVFSGLQAATFFQKFQGIGLYTGATYVRTFPKNHARYGVPGSALDHDQRTHSSTVLHNH